MSQERVVLDQQAMNEASDRLSRTLESLDEFLRSLQLGQPVHVTMTPDGLPRDGGEKTLVFMRRKDTREFAVHVLVSGGVPGPSQDCRPLVECDRETKILAAGYIKALYEKMLDRSKGVVSEVMIAADKAEDSLAWMRAHMPVRRT